MLHRLIKNVLSHPSVNRLYAHCSGRGLFPRLLPSQHTLQFEGQTRARHSSAQFTMSHIDRNKLLSRTIHKTVNLHVNNFNVFIYFYTFRVHFVATL